MRSTTPTTRTTSSRSAPKWTSSSAVIPFMTALASELRRRRVAGGFRLTYAITPPRRTTPSERRRAVAALHGARISKLPIDAVLVYDVQDEAARNASPRPFPFIPKVDPLTYAFEELAVGDLPRVVYRAIADQ